MKRLVTIILILLVLLISLTACGPSQKQKEIINYISNDCSEMTEIERNVLASYKSVSGENYVGETEMYNEITNHTVGLAEELNDKSLEVLDNINCNEILEVHKIYMDYSDKLLDAMECMALGIEHHDDEQIIQANELLDEVNSLSIDYVTAIENLAEENNIRLIEKYD